MFPSILIVDDELSIRQSLSGLLADEGYEVLTASNGYEALKIIEAESPDLVLLDIWMPGMDGIETLKEIKKTHPFIQVIIITGHGTIETAIRATKSGAYDLIEKPLMIDKVIVAINNALNFRRLEEVNRYLRKKTLEKHTLNGTSPAILALKKKIASAAPTDTWILIYGEHGTGKELVARTIHHLSPRAEQPLIDVNCAAATEEMLEAELFGQEKTPYAGTTGRKRGKLELAAEGTLFLDEIGDMSLTTQAKLLRVLQEQKFQRIGGSRTITVNVRVIAATNKDLQKEIEQGRFREDLFFRLNVMPIEVPPLRSRIEDIPVLVEVFLDEFAKQYRTIRKRITPQALEQLCQYSWPGNVRELKNLIGQLVLMTEHDRITEKELPVFRKTSYEQMRITETELFESQLFATNDFHDARKRFEIEFIRRKLSENQHDMALTAKVIGVSEQFLEETLKPPSSSD